jgi:hypothetical protein
MSMTWSAAKIASRYVLDHDDAVAGVRPGGGRLERRRCRGVQANARLVQHVEDADQGRADLSGEADPLSLAAGERVRRAVEREVVEADVDEEAEALRYRPEQRFGDGRVAARELAGRAEGGEELVQAAQRQRRQLGEVPTAELDRERLGAEPAALAGLAGLGDDEAPEILRADGAVVAIGLDVVDLAVSRSRSSRG